VGFNYCSASALAHWAGYRHDHVSAGSDEVLGDLLALILLLEVAGEGTVLLVLVPAQQLDVFALVFVELVNAVSKAVHEDGYGWDLDAAEGGNGAGLRGSSCRVACQESSLSRV